MTVSSATDTIAKATDTVNKGVGTLASTYETFLSLLTTQLKNQDPLSPLDNNQFTQQLTAMTGVQQQLLTNQLLTQMLSQNQANVGAGAINLVGKTVTLGTDEAQLTDKGATWTYDLDQAAAQTKLEVVDNNGQVVWTGAAPTNNAGENTFNWNGKTQAGGALPRNTAYHLRITALDSKGASIAATPHVTGLATGVKSIAGQTLITVNGVDATLTAVTAVSSTVPSTAQADTPTTPAT